MPLAHIKKNIAVTPIEMPYFPGNGSAAAMKSVPFRTKSVSLPDDPPTITATCRMGTGCCPQCLFPKTSCFSQQLSGLFGFHITNSITNSITNGITNSARPASLPAVVLNDTFTLRGFAVTVGSVTVTASSILVMFTLTLAGPFNSSTCSQGLPCVLVSAVTGVPGHTVMVATNTCQTSTVHLTMPLVAPGAAVSGLIQFFACPLRCECRSK